MIKSTLSAANNLKSSTYIGVSVVIPFYKELGWLLEALESVFNQTYDGIEVLLIDDGSQEDISIVKLKYPSIIVLTIENSGPGKARNMGIELAKGEYIAFLDSDDLWEPEKLEIQKQYMDSSNMAWSHCNYQRFWTNNEKLKAVKCGDMQGVIIPKMFLSCSIATPCVMIRRSILISDSILRFSESTRVGEDSYFWFKIAEKYPLGFIDSYLTRVRMRGSNAAFQAYLQLKSRAESCFKIKNFDNGAEIGFTYKLITFGYMMCKVGFDFIESLNLTAKRREYLARIIYFFPYVYFKVISKII